MHPMFGRRYTDDTIAAGRSVRYIGGVRAAYEIFDHTADMGFRLYAETPAGLLEPAARALYAVIGELVPSADRRSRSFDLTASDQETLLRDFLDELLILFERDGQMATGVEVHEFTDRELRVTVDVAGVDFGRSVADREVKAITYHELAIRPIPGGYEGTVIVDI